ncbi:MAG: hypothetical protein D9V45_10480 [Chloroflexi bacterium]|nr:MAG: hypothetical protein D9V45_10480 [Chloroflexota bacterium]
MPVREEVFIKLKNGMTPVEIALERGVTLTTILGYLDQLVGRGWLRRSDILFTVPAEIRNPIIDKLLVNESQPAHEIMISLKRDGLNVEEGDIEVVKKYYDQKHALGDIYEDIRTIEVGLHSLLRKTLEIEYGKGESGWWRQGIPTEIRTKCQERREVDEEGIDFIPYCYTDLLDLKTIIDRKWRILCPHLPNKVTSNKQDFLRDLDHLNQIRRIVMHPVRGGIPSQVDFEFLHGLKERLGFS